MIQELLQNHTKSEVEFMVGSIIGIILTLSFLVINLTALKFKQKRRIN